MKNDTRFQPLLAGLVASTVMLAGCSSTATSTSNSPAGEVRPTQVTEQTSEIAYVQRDLTHVERSGEIYLMRGLLNIFSRGMDVMASRMRSRGLDAVSFNHSNWKPFADDILRRAKQKKVSYPIIIMGHSLGGNEAPKMANYLAANGVKTELIVAFDPTEPQVVGSGIDEVVSYYLPNGRNTIRRTAGFKGKLSNIDMSGDPNIEHTNIEKNRKLQDKAINRTMQLTRKLSRSQRAQIKERDINSAS
jgi:thioesterase domain-containing protein